MADGITVRILGDFGPFSKIGKSIGYQIVTGDCSYLIDCGAPLFEQIGGHGLKSLRGLIITHCHEDHKRWFTDLALFNRYAPDLQRKVVLMTAENVHEEVVASSRAALERSLSADSLVVEDIPYDDYVDYRCLGPRARYRIVSAGEGPGRSRLRVVDAQGAPVGPERAKIVINERSGRARLLFRDPDYREWVEPENFYPFSSRTFYESEPNEHVGEGGIRFSAIKAPVWHGLPAIGVRVRTATETLVFSSDTVHDLTVWERLWREKKPQRLARPEEFASAAVIVGDINDYIERMWSEERYREACAAFEDAVVFHDVSTRAGAVHTDYRVLTHSNLDRRRTMLTHAPDRLTSEWVVCNSEKVFRILGREIFEVVGGELFPLNADIYHRDGGHYYVGYRNPEGPHTVYANDGLLSLSIDETPDRGEPVFKVDLYTDIGGGYFDLLEDAGLSYVVDPRGRVLRVRFTPEGCEGRNAEDRRRELARRPPAGEAPGGGKR
jgi:ribonuclease BN (tRNA processing enzyme)